jgi:hypothetical protein
VHDLSLRDKDFPPQVIELNVRCKRVVGSISRNALPSGFAEKTLNNNRGLTPNGDHFLAEQRKLSGVDTQIQFGNRRARGLSLQIENQGD